MCSPIELLEARRHNYRKNRTMSTPRNMIKLLSIVKIRFFTKTSRYEDMSHEKQGHIFR
jgi:hypothetical protein